MSEHARNQVAALRGATLDHVGVAVADLDTALGLWTGVLGGTLVHRETNAGQQVTEAMVRFAGDAEVQLLAPTGPASPISRFLASRGPGLQQIAFAVPDIDEACTALRAAGLRLVYDEPTAGTAGSRINFVHPGDAGGVLIEIVQRTWEH